MKRGSGRLSDERRPLLSAWPLALAALGLVAAALLGPAAAAFAHSNLLFSTPSANATVAVAPKALSLVFDQPVTVSSTPLRLMGPRGEVSLGKATLGHGGTSIDVPVSSGQGPGVYAVTWQVTARDGDVVSGGYQFAIGPKSISLGGGTTVSTKGAWETTVLRGLLFAALALSLGEYVGPWLFRRIPNRPKFARAWMPWTTIGGAAASAGLAVLLLGDGSLIAGLTRPSFSILASSPGVASVIALLGFLLAALGSRLLGPRWSWLPLLAVVAAEALRAHPGSANPSLGIPLTVIHLGVAMLWAGALVYVLRTAGAWRKEPDAARAAIAAYSRPAAWLFITVAVTGLGSALLLVPLSQIVSTDYGRVLVIKVFVVAAAAAFAWIARRRLQRKATPEHTVRAARLETAALAGVLALSAILTVLPPPADPNAPVPFAPPANGPSVPAAALSGFVNITANASAGQLVVQLTPPETTGQAGQPITPSATLTGALTSPHGKTTQLAFRDCGTGCFFAAVKWRDGVSRLTLTPSVETWPTANTGLTVDWPPKPAGDILTKTIAAMKAVPEFTLYERVTADSSKGPGKLMTFHLTGTDFVRRALFATGKVPAVVRLPDLNGDSRLAISYPAEGAVEELIIGPDGKILKKTLTSSDLVSDTFVYPEGESG